MKSLGEMMEELNPSDIVWMLLLLNKVHIGCTNGEKWNPNQTVQELNDQVTNEFAHIIRSLIEETNGTFTMQTSRDEIVRRILEASKNDPRSLQDVYTLFPKK